MAERIIAVRKILRMGADGAQGSFDELAGEEPLELRIDGTPMSVTMRTPGHDFDLVLGFCLTEGILESPQEIASMRYCGDGGDGRRTPTYNVVDVRRRQPGAIDERLRRNMYTTSSCGVCGTTSIDAVRKKVRNLSDDDLPIEAAVLAALPERLAEQQRVFARTGGLHAAGLADRDGTMHCVREDVGRHNAVDKVLGWAAGRDGFPLQGRVLVVSGRVAFEIVQKAAIAGVPLIAAVSAPTSLAVDLAESVGMTLVGFVRDGTMNVYSGAQRVVATSDG